VRDYGVSGPSQHPNTLSWGYDYHLDLLGAWDYAVEDPEGILGAPLSPEKVGIMGFSKGALGAAIAFGLETRIPGAWIDSAPFSGLKGMIDHTIRPYLGRITPIFVYPVWWSAKFFAETPLDYYDGLQLLANCTPPRRQVAISQGIYDTDVPMYEGQHAISLLGGFKTCYALEVYTPPEYCNTWTHHMEMWEFPDSTRNQLCHFWGRTFRLDTSVCSVKMPSYQFWEPPNELPPGTPPLPH